MQNRIELIDVEKIKPYKNNPRVNDGAVDAVAASIREFGFKSPVIVDADMTIICGHTRLKAAKRLNLRQVPCIIADDLTPEQVRAYRLADNKSGELATWDLDLLDIELGSIDIDMQQFGFDDLELDPLDLDDGAAPTKRNLNLIHCPKCGFEFEVDQ